MQLTKSRIDSAEYYLTTRLAINTFNEIVNKMTGIIDVVRGQTPTTRDGDIRIWGPFKSEDIQTWETRVVMQRSVVSETLLHMEYWIQVRPEGTDDSAWTSYLHGNYESKGSARNGNGEIELLISDVRNALYPIDNDPGLKELDYLLVSYDNAGFPITVRMKIENNPISIAKTQAKEYQYRQEQDGSGSMTFDLQGLTDIGIAVTAKMVSQWIGSGAGRADLTVKLAAENQDLFTTLGTDCWDIDSIETYSFRVRDEITGETKNVGTAASCLF